MKSLHRNIAIVGGIALIILVFVLVLITSPDKEKQDPTYPTIDNASEIYEDAIDILNSTDSISLRISYKKETLLNSEFLTEQSIQNITYQGLRTDSLKACAEETLIIGNQTVELSEIFNENTLYLTIEECNFSGEMDADTFLSRYTPAQPLNAENYKTITGEDTGNGYTIYFSAPTKIETWVLNSEAASQQATGSAYINADGHLTKSVYSASYTIDNTHFRISTTVEINYDSTASVTPPVNTADYIVLENPDAPRLLEKACGYLLDTTGIKGVCTDTIYCEAFGDKREQTVVLETSQDTTWSAQVDTTVEIINSSKAGTSTNYSQRETFINNTYSISVDGAPETYNKDIDINAMRSYCSDLLVGTILLPQYITSATVTESEDTYIIELNGNNEFAKLIDAEACTTLYRDANILSSTAKSYSVDSMRCYLTIDKNTGLPTDSGLDYQGIYIIEKHPYRMEFRSDHYYTLLNEEAGAE